MTDVVFLHGIGTGPQGWSPQVEALSSGGDAVFAPNLTGGFARGWNATIEEVAMLVAGRAPVDLCGISLGALLALRIAADRPSFTRRLVLCAGFAELPAGVRRRVSVIAGLARFVPKRLLHRQLVAGIPEPHRSIAAGEIAPLKSRRLARLMREAAGARVDPALVLAPTLVLCGERDKANLPLTRSLADALPNATLELVPDAGHVANLDNPAAFTTLVADFLSSG